jgi:hypothetical protein
MTAPPGCVENRGTLCVSPQKGTAGAAGAANAGRAAEARRALAPICRFHQRVALRSLHGLRSALPVTTGRKIFLARRAGLAVCLPFIGRRRSTRHPHHGGNGVGTRDVQETESSSEIKAQYRLLLADGGVWGARDRPGVIFGEAETRAPTTTSSVSAAFRSSVPMITCSDTLQCSATSRRKLAAWKQQELTGRARSNAGPT